MFDQNEPEVLKENSNALTQTLSSENIEEEELLKLVLGREQIIKDLLNRGNVEDFARKQYQTIQELTEIVTVLREQKKNEIVNFLRSRKAATKYTKRGR